jgi:predicted transcriptional regulator
MARCPAHSDHTPSLSVRLKNDRVLLHCFAGCDHDAILKELGLSPGDLSPNGRRDKRRVVAKYNYVAEDGSLLFQVVRYDPKDFRQRRRGADGVWEWTTHGTRKVLYRLPRVLDAVRQKHTVFVVEGEKDARALEKQGFVATTNPGGAGKWRPEFSEFLRDAKVVILPDNDASGVAHARSVAQALTGVAADIRVVQLPALPDKGDVSDWLKAGGTPKRLRRLVHGTAVWMPSGSEDGLAGRRHLRLLTADEVEHLPPVEYLVEGTLPAGALVELHGAPDCGKTFLALDLCLSIATGGRWLDHKTLAGPTVYVLGEGKGGIGGRLRAWRSAHRADGHIETHFLTEPVRLLDPGHVQEFIGALKGLPKPPVLIVIDTLHRCFAGGDENSAQDMGRAIASLDRIRIATGATVLLLHHKQKNGREERGSSALRGALDVMMSLTNNDGTRTLRCEKARDFAEFDNEMFGLIQRGESCVVGRIDVAERLRANDLTRREHEALAVLEAEFDGDAQPAPWRKRTEIPERTFYHNLPKLCARGLIKRVEAGKQARYRLTEDGRNAIAAYGNGTAIELPSQSAESLPAAAPLIEGRHCSDGHHSRKQPSVHIHDGELHVRR